MDPYGLVSKAGVWHWVEERESGIEVTVRVPCDRFDLFRRLFAAQPTELPDYDGESERVTARLSYPVLSAVRHLLAFSDQVEKERAQRSQWLRPMVMSRSCRRASWVTRSRSSSGVSSASRKSEAVMSIWST